MELGISAATQELAADHKESDVKHSPDPRPSREHATPGIKPDEQGGARRPPKRRRAAKENGTAGAIRYFLTRPSSDGIPELDQEMPDEHQTLVAALKQERNFVTVKEWRAKVDIKKGAPVIEKDPVLRE